MTEERYQLAISPTPGDSSGEHLPEAAAFAAYEFIVGPLLETRVASGSGSVHHSRIDTAPDAAPIA